MSKVAEIVCDMCGKVVNDGHSPHAESDYFEITHWTREFKEYHVCNATCGKALMATLEVL